MKKLLASLLSVMMVMCFMPGLAWAADGAETALPVADGGVVKLEAGKMYKVNATALTPNDTTKEITVDLNGSTLIVDGVINFGGEGKALTLKDTSGNKGTLKFTEKTGTTDPDIVTQTGGTVNAENINVETPNTAFFPLGSAAKVNITGCNVTAATYCVGTNAKTQSNYGVIITLKDSVFNAVGRGENDFDTCGVIINVEGTLNIDNCKITGHRQGVIVRAGTATIKNSEIKTSGEYSGTSRDGDNWSSGNEVNKAALVIGNNPSSDAYNAKADVTIENTTVEGTDTAPAVYVNENKRDNCGTELAIKGEDTNIGNFTVNSSSTPTIEISGGTFTDAEAIKEYIAQGMTTDENGKVVIGKDAIAEVNGVIYTSLDEALSAANAGDTVKLLNDVTLNKELTIGTGIILDGDGHTISGPEAISTPPWNLVTVTLNANGVGVKNITLKTSKANKSALHVYCANNITVENVIFDTTTTSGGAGAVVNGATVEFKGNIEFKNGSETWGGINVDTRHQAATVKFADGAKVTANGDQDVIYQDKENQNGSATIENAEKAGLEKDDEGNYIVKPAPVTPPYIPPTTQNPTIEADSNATVTLSDYGTKATIKVADGYELVDVTVNGVSKGKVDTLTGLKTGDKVVVTTKKIITVEDEIAAVKATKLVARSANAKAPSGKKAIKVYWFNKDGSALNLDGYEIYRSTKKNKFGKKPIYTAKSTQYFNTSAKKGTRYYYKVRGFKEIGGEKVYTDFSLKAIRTAK